MYDIPHHTPSKDDVDPRMERLGRIAAIFTLAVVVPGALALAFTLNRYQEKALSAVPEADRQAVQAVATRGGAKCESLREELRPACAELKRGLSF